MSLYLGLQPEPLSLLPRSEPQLCYVLLTIGAANPSAGARPVNWAFVADASRSMRIPIIREEQFRELARAGGAQEILVDGVPVWQLLNPVPPEIKAQAPSALDYVSRALHSVVEQLDHADRFTLIACAEEAQVLVPSTSGASRVALVQGIARLNGLRLGEATDLAQGMRLGLAELAQGRIGTNREQVDRLLLLTDGFTQRPEACLALAREAAASGVAISTLGLGGEFQDDLLTTMADLSGGRAVLLRRADAIPRAVADELAAARAVAARTVTLHITLSNGVALRRITQISPTLTPLDSDAPSPALTIHLGDLDGTMPTRLLLELLAPASPRRDPSLAPSRVRLAQLRLTSDSHAASTHDLVVTYTPRATATPAPVLDAAARANAARLQRRALTMASNGDRNGAAKLLRAVAARLTELGETDLAASALHEAATLEQTGQSSGLAAKELTYATRRLGQGEA